MEERRTTVEGLADLLEVERERLVRLCTQLTGNRDAADDLAQETLVEAWRSLTRLRDRDGLTPWLSAIARNVCYRWRRARGREAVHLVSDRHPEGAVGLDRLASRDRDPVLDLEQDELAVLLDRALTLLPAETRDALIASYVDDLPQDEVANRLGLNPGAVRVRLHRGKLALRDILATQLREEAQALDLAVPDPPTWRETRIWCPFCGHAPLRVFSDADGYSYRCAAECVPRGTIVGYTGGLTSNDALTSLKAILTRTLLALDARYRRTLTIGEGRCITCGADVTVSLGPVQQTPTIPAFARGLRLHCAGCANHDEASLWHLLLDLPATQPFWRRHPRMCALPVYEVERQGRPALISGFVSLDDSSRLEIVSDRESLAVRDIFGDIS